MANKTGDHTPYGENKMCDVRGNRKKEGNLSGFSLS